MRHNFTFGTLFALGIVLLSHDTTNASTDFRASGTRIGGSEASLDQPVNPPASRTGDTSGGLVPIVCRGLGSKGVPSQAISAALDNPNAIYGFGQLQNPNVPESPYNTRQLYLTLANPNTPFDARWNGLRFRSGCS